MVTQFSLERPYFEKWDHWLRVFVPLGVERENKNISVALVKLNVKKKKKGCCLTTTIQQTFWTADMSAKI